MDWITKLLGGWKRAERDKFFEEYHQVINERKRYAIALTRIEELETPKMANGVKRAVNIAKEALYGEQDD